MTRVAESRLAIHGGSPVRPDPLPFAVSSIGEEEIQEVVATLRSGWLATGPKVARFESRFAEYVGCRHAVGVTSGSSALHLILESAGVGPGDEVITTSLTYVASANEIVRRGATPVFADVDPLTLNLDPRSVLERITPATKAILLTHFAGRACDMRSFERLAAERGLLLLSDSAHAIETRYENAPLAPRFPMSAFSFHPAKNMTTGEGGMIATDDEALARDLRIHRNHGVDRDAWRRKGTADSGPWDASVLGHKCNMSDLQASLGIHQLARLESNLARRTEIAAYYDRRLRGLEQITLPLEPSGGERHARHLYTLLWDPQRGSAGRAEFRRAIRAENICTGLHYPLIHRLSYYQDLLGVADDRLPVTSRVGDSILTLPLYPSMSDADVESVVEAVRKVARCRP